MTREKELKQFPMELVRPVEARFGGSLHYNPYCDLSPTIWYNFGVTLAPIELGESAVAPDLFGDTLETQLALGGIVIPQCSWKGIAGEYGPVEDQGESSVYVSNVHVPIDIESVVFSRLSGCNFRIQLALHIDFEHAGAGYANAGVALEIEAQYEGLSFCIPRWTNPEEVVFPKPWRIPARFNNSTVSEMFARFVDLDGYRLEEDEDSFHFHPIAE